VDIWSEEKRSQVMSRIRSKNTRPEILVRSLLHSMGYRFRIHRRDLPGHPDIVLPKYRAVIFVHGCFWHQHPGCPNAVMPKTNTEKWKTKLEQNVERDRQHLTHLKALGWRCLVIWECEIEKQIESVRQKIVDFIASE
jgi:DNA mismatch endonuclease (patch repair protein)